ncbi:MAG: SCO1664 family protein [Chloroflexi bacterium]|nr:SCO1664 family protein [Chloroflexota bacterium]
MLNEMPLDSLLRVLTGGDMELLGLMPYGSNYTFLARIADASAAAQDDDAALLSVYKPRRGEAPLWDFTNGTLCMREYAAYLVSEALGWRIVPPTVLRDGDHGFGSVQLYIENDEEQHFFTFRDDPTCREQLQRICIFDLITNNADRKSGHCLRDTDGHVWAIDHGICFNRDHKLRTVIWDFASQKISDSLLSDVQTLRDRVEADQTIGRALRQLLDEDEVRAFVRRIDGVLKLRMFPSPSRSERSIPWPPV